MEIQKIFIIVTPVYSRVNFTILGFRSQYFFYLMDAYYAFANPWYPNGVHHINSSGELSATYSDQTSSLYGVV